MSSSATREYYHKANRTRFWFLMGACAAALVAVGVAAFCPERNCHHHNGGAVAASTVPLVKVTTKREGDVTRFFVENNEFCEVTMTFEITAKNLKGPFEFPYTMSFPARQKIEAFALRPENPDAKWEYSYTNYYKLGNHLAKHDDSVRYALPYAPGSKFKVTQAYGGSYSHKGSNKYAIDWKMPEGTPVLAAREGEVVKIKDDSTTGGPSMSFDPYNNFVLVRHPDGTLGHYCHLLKDSIVVKVGDRVTSGQMLAESGNTGFSSGPHLHFCVFRTLSGKERESVPIKFRVDGETSATLVAGRNYRSVPSGMKIEAARPSATVAGAGSP